jgi:hypothetical protein
VSFVAKKEFLVFGARPIPLFSTDGVLDDFSTI